MEEEGGSAATELPMCNYGKPSTVQMSTTEKKNLIDDFGVVRDEIYMKIKVQYLKIKVQERNMKNKKKIQRPQNGFCLYQASLTLALYLFIYRVSCYEH